MRVTRRGFCGSVGLGAVSGCIGITRDDEGGSSVDWLTTPLEDVRTGEEFTISQFAVPTVVHTYATWCGTCRRQHEEFVSLKEAVGEDVVVVDLNVDSSESASAVRAHATRNGFDWRFAVLSDSFIEALVEEFGRSVVSPPQSPVIVVCPDDRTHAYDKIVSASELSTITREQC